MRSVPFLFVKYVQSPEVQFRFVFFPFKKLCRTPLFSAVCGPIWQQFLWTFDLGSGQTCIKFQPNRWTDGRVDATFEGKKHKPKFKGQTLTMYHLGHEKVPGEGDRVRALAHGVVLVQRLAEELPAVVLNLKREG